MASSCNYPDDWNTKNYRSKTIAFVKELQALSDKYGIYVSNADSDAGCGNLLDADGKNVAIDFVCRDNKYFGCYQELVGERPPEEESDDDE